MAKMAELTLANICLDVQIGICMCLHPSDILALRKTCKALQPSTRQRIVWVTALHRVCLENTLFLPSFPISDMSDLEIEKAAMGPRRWIELCGAFEKQHLNDPSAILRPRTTRFINDLITTRVNQLGPDIFIVPGGRYLVSSSRERISVLDLRYTSSSDCKLIASVGVEVRYKPCIVQFTPDGMGLIIFSSSVHGNFSVYEIYPQNERPQLTKIGHLGSDASGNSLVHLLLPDTVMWYHFNDYSENYVFAVWDYRLNHSIRFCVDADIFEDSFKLMATKTAVIILYNAAVLIWAIPPLSPQPPDIFHYNPTNIPPLFTIPFPDIYSTCLGWNMMSSWYFGTSQSLYFDMLCRDSKLHRFQIVLEPDLSAASLHAMNTPERITHDFGYVSFQDYRICEDTLVSCWHCYDDNRDGFQCGVYTGLTSSRFSNDISQRDPAAKMLLPGAGINYSCPASGRIVRLDRDNGVTRVAVLDFF